MHHLSIELPPKSVVDEIYEEKIQKYINHKNLLNYLFQN